MSNEDLTKKRELIQKQYNNACARLGETRLKLAEAEKGFRSIQDEERAHLEVIHKLQGQSQLIGLMELEWEQKKKAEAATASAPQK